MKDGALPAAVPVPWRSKPIALAAEFELPLGLGAFLDRVRQVEYVTGLAGLELMPAWVMRTEFALRAGQPDRLEAWFSQPMGQWTVRFEILTTARNLAEQAAALHDLRQRLISR